MDKIRIENLEIFAKHGVFPEENFLGQKFVLSAVLHTDTRKAGLTDELSYSVHYGEVSHLIKKVVEENTWKLLETVAEATPPPARAQAAATPSGGLFGRLWRRLVE